MADPKDPWGVASTSPDTAAKDPWGVAQTAPDTSAVLTAQGDTLPPQTGQAGLMSPEAERTSALAAGLGESTKKPQLGSSLGDIFDTIGSHAAGMVTGPFHAFTDEATPEEKKTYGDDVDSGLGHLSLGVDRMLVRPTTDAAKEAVKHFKAGDTEGGLESAEDAIPIVGPWARNVENETREKGAVAALAGLGTDIAAPKVAGEGIGRTLGKLTAPAAKIDSVIPGDTVTPREVFNTAADHDVNLDRAQATGSPAAKLTKKVTEHSLGGKAPFEANTEANIDALNDWAHESQALKPDVDAGNIKSSPPEMTREDFGNAAKSALAQHQLHLNNTAGQTFNALDKRVGAVTPDTTSVSDMAQRIAAENADYYKEHPELLKGGAGQAWNIVNDLGTTEGTPATPPVLGKGFQAGQVLEPGKPAAPRNASSWSDLHRLRSDLMNTYRSPDIVGTRAEGWLKQLTGAVDDSMTGASSKLGPGDLGDFRDANELYRRMKDSYDNPQHPFFHIVRSPDGLTAANTIAGFKPELMRQFNQAVTESGNSRLTTQLQRQTISRMLDPNGDGVPDLKGLPTRLTRANAEMLQGTLSPAQLQDLQALARTSRIVYADSNPSGTAKVAQPVAEGSAVGSGLLSAGTHLASGNLPAAAASLAPAGLVGAERVASKFLTSPGRTAAAFEPGVDGAKVSGTVKDAGRAGAVASDIQHSPDSHRFSISQWADANPSGDANAAAEEAARQGFEVID